MLEFLSLKKETFGLDITDLSVKIIKLQKKGKLFSLASYNKVDISPGIIEDGIIKDEDSLAKVIKSACESVKGKKLKTKYVVASLPEEKSFLQVIQMPKMTEEELRLAVPFQAENYIPLSIKDVYLDFQVIPPAKENFEHLDVLIVAMPKKIIDSYMSCFKKAGLIPLVFEIESEAIARAMTMSSTGYSSEDIDASLIIIDLGKSNTDFIVYSGRSIRFTFSIPISSEKLTKAVAEDLNVEFKKAEKLKIEYGIADGKAGDSEKVEKAIEPVLEDLVAQIQKYISFYYDHTSSEYLNSSGKIEKILLCGGGSQLKGLPEYFSKKIGIPTEIGNPASGLILKNNKDAFNKESLSFATALGLSIRGACNKKDNN